MRECLALNFDLQQIWRLCAELAAKLSISQPIISFRSGQSIVHLYRWLVSRILKKQFLFHIGRYYIPATCDCMKGQSQKENV